MKKIKLLEQFLEEQLIKEGLFDVVTKSKAFIKNPISATKITNNGKKLAQAEIDNAANALDFEKRKLAASKAAKQKIEALKKKGDSEGAQKVKDDFADNKEVLAKAHDQKSDALTDKVSSIKDRIEDLSKKNSALKDLASLVKTAARVKKNEVLIKGADAEEKKQLKLQMQQDAEKIQGLQKGFGDYEGSGDEDKKSEDKPKDKKDVNIDTNVPGKTSTDQPVKKEPTQSAKTPADKSLTTTSDPKDEAPEDAVTRTRQEVKDIQDQISNNQNAIDSNKEKIADFKAGKYDKKKITDPEAEIARLEKDTKYAEETVINLKDDLSKAVAVADDTEKKLPKQAAESLIALKSFKDFVTEKNKS
jgi:hypothetical protein